MPCECGAGDCYYAPRLSKEVGPDGRVFEENIIQPDGACNQRLQLLPIHNAEAIAGQNTDPHLPKGLAAVMAVNSYHEFTEPDAMNARILESLKPGGRYVIGDYSEPRPRTQSRADQAKAHQLSPALIRADLERAGFRIVRIIDPFRKQLPGNSNLYNAVDMYLVVAIRPEISHGRPARQLARLPLLSPTTTA